MLDAQIIATPPSRLRHCRCWPAVVASRAADAAALRFYAALLID